MMPLPQLSVVIPALNESARIADAVSRILAIWPSAQVMVADGQSTDETSALARAAGATVIPVAERSRGVQLKAGAHATESEWILFIHADTRLTDEAAEAAKAYLAQPQGSVAMFQISFDAPTLLLRFSSWWTRYDSVFTRFSDQGILIRRDFYTSLGGFQSWPLFEDVDLIRRARRQGRIDVLPAKVLTSARRFRRHGPLRQQIRNSFLLLRFLAGADPRRLARHYPAMKV